MSSHYTSTAWELNGAKSLAIHAQRNLEHASGCSDSQCPVPVCVNLKMAASHARTCAQQECSTCHQVKLITLHHIKSCKRGDSCPVPLCLETKVQQEYVKLVRDLGGKPSTTSAPARPANRPAPLPRAKRPISRDPEPDDAIGTPRKLPRYGAEESHDSQAQNWQRSNKLQRRAGLHGNTIGQCGTTALRNLPDRRNPTLEVLQRLLRVLMLLQNSGQEQTVFGLLEQTVRDAQDKMTSFKPDHVSISQQQRIHGDPPQCLGAGEEHEQSLSSPLNVWCPSSDFIRQLFEWTCRLASWPWRAFSFVN